MNATAWDSLTTQTCECETLGAWASGIKSQSCHAVDKHTCGEPNSVKKESYSLPFTDVFPGVCMVSPELKEGPHDSLS